MASFRPFFLNEISECMLQLLHRFFALNRLCCYEKKLLFGWEESGRHDEEGFIWGDYSFNYEWHWNWPCKCYYGFYELRRTHISWDDITASSLSTIRSSISSFTSFAVKWAKKQSRIVLWWILCLSEAQDLANMSRAWACMGILRQLFPHMLTHFENHCQIILDFQLWQLLPPFWTDFANHASGADISLICTYGTLWTMENMPD